VWTSWVSIGAATFMSRPPMQTELDAGGRRTTEVDDGVSFRVSWKRKMATKVERLAEQLAALRGPARLPLGGLLQGRRLLLISSARFR
jgi:hypothetical protein